jgi:hypothetical protein
MLSACATSISTSLLGPFAKRGGDTPVSDVDHTAVRPEKGSRCCSQATIDQDGKLLRQTDCRGAGEEMPLYMERLSVVKDLSC